LRGLKNSIIDFELAITVAVSTFGLGAEEAFATCNWTAD